MISEEEKIGKFKFAAKPFSCDFSGRLFPGCLANQMLDAADFHAERNSVGVRELNEHKQTWVLSRFALELVESPYMYDEYSIETWVAGLERFFTDRMFYVKAKDGRVLAKSDSMWAILDTETRQVSSLQGAHKESIENCVIGDRSIGMEPVSRVRIKGDTEIVREDLMSYSDIDPNGHVNSMRYIDHVLDLYSPEFYKEHHLRRIDIAFVAESYFSETLRMSRVVSSEASSNFENQISNENSSNFVHTYRLEAIPNLDSQKTKIREVCRCSLQFE